jgi:phosphoglycolate phosphatase-like HAD superfamily hydrolase
VVLVLWDIDGTLVDTAGHGRHAFQEAFEAVMGRPPGRVEFAGRTDHQIALAMLNHEREALPRVLDQLATALEARKEMMRRDGHAYPGVPETLQALHGREDVVQSLLTGNIEANAALKVGAFGLERWLDFQVGAYGSDPHEERSDLVAVARQRVRVKYGEPARAVLVGDTPHDVQAAHEAGARAVAVATGFSDVHALLASRPDVLLDDLRDTAAAVEAIVGAK